MLLSALILGTALTLAPGLVAGKDNDGKPGMTVDLGYAKYQGTTTPGINQWLGIRYAAAPVGDLRFRGPKPPTDEMKKGVQKATKHMPWCLPTPSKDIQKGASEDCLYADVYAPSDMSKPHPVYVFIQGGGYGSNASPNMDGSKLVEAGDHDIVVVTFNYRVGPWGFLASKEVKADGDLNAGNLDQRWLLQWVQKYIHNFGGDPKRVTLGGASAGAASVNMQLMAYGGRDDGLFHAVASESNSYGQQLTVDESQYQYDALIDRVGCKKEKDTLKCLRSKDAKTIAENNEVIPTPGGKGQNPLFFYSNVIDGDYTPDYAYKLLDEGKFIKVPSIFGGTTNEGSIFTPADMNNYGDINDFLKNQFVKLTTAQLAEIDHWYPQSPERYPKKGDYWATASNLWGEMRYNCPGINLNIAFANRGVKDGWHYHWDVQTDQDRKSGRGAPHTAEGSSIWGSSGGVAKDNIPYIQGYWASFIRTHDPNKLKHKEAPVWEAWDNHGYKKMKFVNDPTKNSMETVDQTQRDRCAAMMKIGKEISQ